MIRTRNRVGTTRDQIQEATQFPNSDPVPESLFINKQSLTSELRRLAGNREVRVGIFAEGPKKQAAYTLARSRTSRPRFLHARLGGVKVVKGSLRRKRGA